MAEQHSTLETVSISSDAPEWDSDRSGPDDRHASDGASRSEVKRGETVTIRIESIASGGAGVGRLPDGRAVFVQRSAPGDEVRVRITELRKRWGKGEVVSLVAPGPGRREAPCMYYARGCGGCTLEHLTYVAQLESKGRIVSDALARIGKLEDVVPPEVVPSPNEFRYRNRVSFTLRRIRGGRVVAGFHELENPGRILDIGGGCMLFEKEIGEVWNRLRKAWGGRAKRLPDGQNLRLTLRTSNAGAPADTTRTGVVLVIEGGEGDGDAVGLLQDVDGLVAVWKADPHGGAPRLLAGSGRETPPTFVQVNQAAGELLAAAVVREAGAPRGQRVVDAYCGIGVYGRLLAKHGAEVTGIEVDAAAVAQARVHPPKGFSVLQGTVEERLDEALPANLVILNPPRTGLDEAVTDVLNAGVSMGGKPHRPRRIVYVSCDPATLARDARRLARVYRLERLQAFDLFPQTAHVETIATFVLEEGA